MVRQAGLSDAVSGSGSDLPDAAPVGGNAQESAVGRHIQPKDLYRGQPGAEQVPARAAVVVDGANRHDMKLLAATLDGVVVARPEPTAEAPQHLCLDAGYDYAATRGEVAARGSVAHIRPRGEERALTAAEPGWRARRWVVERTHSWLNRSRRLLVRWEKRPELYLAFVHLACAQLIFSKLARLRRADGGPAQGTTAPLPQAA